MRIDGFVLAGGRSRRMGRDKARVALPDGRLLAEQVALVLAAHCDRVSIVRRGQDDEAPFLGKDGTPLPIVHDADGEEDPHPLWGLVTACRVARSPWVIVAPCDVPYLQPAGIRGLIESVTGWIGRAADPGTADRLHDPVEMSAVAFDGERVHPLVGAFPRAVGPLAAEAARSGMRVQEFVAAAARVKMPADWLKNLNAPDDLG